MLGFLGFSALCRLWQTKGHKILSILEVGKNLLHRLIPSRGYGGIDSLATLQEFTCTRASFIAQKTMYGYVKTRMGTSYPEMFRDNTIAHSLRIATLEYFAVCLSDLTLFTSWHALKSADIDDARRIAIALQIYEHGIRNQIEIDVQEFDPNAAIDKFKQRIAFVRWDQEMTADIAFSPCLDAIIHWAPIADRLKTFDTEIVRNSVRFAWIDIRKLFFKRLKPDAIAAELSQAPRSTENG